MSVCIGPLASCDVGTVDIPRCQARLQPMVPVLRQLSLQASFPCPYDGQELWCGSLRKIMVTLGAIHLKNYCIRRDFLENIKCVTCQFQ